MTMRCRAGVVRLGRFRKKNTVISLLRSGTGPGERKRYLCSSRSLAGLPGVAERPERNPEQGQVLDEELPRDRRQRGEAAQTRLPNSRCGDEETQVREEIGRASCRERV